MTARGEALRADDNAEALKASRCLPPADRAADRLFPAKACCAPSTEWPRLMRWRRPWPRCLEEAAAPKSGTEKPARRARPVTVARRKPSERVTGRKLPGRRVSTQRRTATGKVGKPAAAAAGRRGKVAKAASAAKKAVNAGPGRKWARQRRNAGQVRPGKVAAAKAKATAAGPGRPQKVAGGLPINAEENVEWS